MTEEDKSILRKTWQEEYAENEAELAKLIERCRDSIPTNQKIISLIPSKAVRDYLVKIGHEFSERERFILKCYLAPKNNEEMNSVWEKGRYVSLPHPFRRGDIVAAFGYAENERTSTQASEVSFFRRIHTPHTPLCCDASVGVCDPTLKSHKGSDYDLGIMTSFKDDKAWQDWDRDIRTRIPYITDFSDVATTVEFLQGDGSFSHNHPNPMELEFAKDIPGALTERSARTKLLVASSDLLKGQGSIEYYEILKESYDASPEHLLELLEKVYSALRRYADSFDCFRSLYIPDDASPIKKLSAGQELEAGQILKSMEIETWRIKNYVADLTLPIKALSNHKLRGTFYREMSEEERAELSRLAMEIQEEHKHIQARISNFLKNPDCPRREFYQKRLAKEINHLFFMLNRENFCKKEIHVFNFKMTITNELDTRRLYESSRICRNHKVFNGSI